VTLEVIIPAYNESDRLRQTIAAAAAYLAAQPYSAALVVVDNGSVDTTADIAAVGRLGPVPVHLIGCSRPGKGAAIQRGVLTSEARFVGFVDADLATPMETLDRVVPLLEGGTSVVVGSRRCAGASYEVEQTPVRRLGSWVFHQLAQMVVPGVDDTQCGFKFFRGPAAKKIFDSCTVNGFAFDVELLALARRLGYDVVEVPVAWSDRDGSTFSALRDGPRAMSDILSTAVRLRAAAPVAAAAA
jgi:glycosyltransferase involved in cell wall biosynthesis